MSKLSKLRPVTTLKEDYVIPISEKNGSEYDTKKTTLKEILSYASIMVDTYAEIAAEATGDVPKLFFVETDETKGNTSTFYIYHPTEGVFYIPKVEGHKLGYSNGVDDTATINALLNAVPAGTVVKGLPGQEYFISSAILIPSGKYLDMSGCRVTANANLTGNLVNNKSRSSGRTLMDGVTTASSTTLTSATAAFTAADQGKTIWIWRAGYEYDIHKTSIASVTNSTTAVLTDAALAAGTGLCISIGTRDSIFGVIGGTWTRPASADPGGINGAGMRFERADNWFVKDIVWNQQALRGYAVNPCDCTGFTVDKIHYNTMSDGVHLNGPCDNGLIQNLTGYTRDDTVSLTPNDWPGYGTIYGDITNITIKDVRVTSTNGSVIKILGGSTATRCINIFAKNISGYAINSTFNTGGLVWIGDDTSYPATTGGLLDNIIIENPQGKYKDGICVVYLNGTNIKRVRIRGLHEDNDTMRLNGLVWQAVGTIESLHVSDVFLGSFGGGTNTDIVRCDAAVKCAVVENIMGTPTKLGLIYSVGAATGNTTRLIVDKVVMNTAASGSMAGIAKAAVTGAVLTKLQISNVSIPDNVSTFLIGDFVGTVDVQLTNIMCMPWVGIANLRATTVMVVSGYNCNFGGRNFQVTAGYQLAIRSLGFPIDISQATSKSLGDAAYNTASGLSCGVGQVAYTGTAWKNLITDATY
jgi:hypothetical protein